MNEANKLLAKRVDRGQMSALSAGSVLSLELFRHSLTRVPKIPQLLLRL